ncbi:hypothetical protein Psch_00161 [Pelotomaculum schinkii]|uniref:Uncharacterized protein n=1 Tax=Pelotomaculum schinkii TaxID=78350 RepID=A0A4Y7RCZ2_9FIRM|nr:hypothetical protein [Pelotomaculum sp. FP]TEB06629.1 hypothetical protein Psch_00161 [Pelotomaculum schinkii]TEB17576.1 hypothetical protein Psfp_00448 [Pelotomaculum sp. FP]
MTCDEILSCAFKVGASDVLKRLRPCVCRGAFAVGRAGMAGEIRLWKCACRPAVSRRYGQDGPRDYDAGAVPKIPAGGGVGLFLLHTGCLPLNQQGGGVDPGGRSRGALKALN